MELDIKRINRRYESLRAERSGWEPAWKSLSELFLPNRFRSDTDSTAHQSPKLNGRLVNSCGVLAMRTLAAGMQGGMTSPVRPWFRIVVKGGEASGDSRYNEWLERVTDTMQALLHRSNFYNAIHSLYSDLGTFGTALLVETADADGLHFNLVRAGEYVIDTNGNDEVDTFFRRINMTARQMVDSFGDAVPDMVRNLAEKGGGSQRFDVIHGVFPNKDITAGSNLGTGSKPFTSVYWTNAGGMSGKQCVLSVGGFDMFPAFAPRWDVSGTDVYGRSPAMDVEPDCKMLQAMTASLRKMQHKIASPPVIADRSLQAFGVELDPDSVNWVDFSRISSGAPVIPVDVPNPNALGQTMQGISGVENVVREGLYTDLFRMIMDSDRRQITAAEIQMKQQEKLSLIGPVVERMIKELLEPVIMRTFGLMKEYDALPPLPENVEFPELDITFESVLAQAQKITTTSAIDAGFAFVVNVAQANRDVLDLLNYDNMARSYLERIGMPAGCLMGVDDVQRLREQRAEAAERAQAQAQMMQQIQAAEGLSASAKNLGETPIGASGMNLMDSLIGGMGAM